MPKNPQKKCKEKKLTKKISKMQPRMEIDNMTDFPRSKVRVVLTGYEWTAIIAKLTGEPLSELGSNVLDGAIKNLGKQVLYASNKAAKK